MSIAAQSPELLTLKDVVSMVRLGRSNLYNLMARGKFPHPVRIGGANRWRRSDLQAWIEGLETKAPVKSGV